MNKCPSSVMETHMKYARLEGDAVRLGLRMSFPEYLGLQDQGQRGNDISTSLNLLPVTPQRLKLLV